MWGRKKSGKGKEFLIFIDVDGVLNTTNSHITKYEIQDENVRALGMLKDTLEKCRYEVKVVLSSTWRLGYDEDYEQCSKQVQRLITKLKEVGIVINGKTIVYKDKSRDVEISRYIRGYQLKDIEFEYIILDDDESIFSKEALQAMTFYKVNERTGLTMQDVEKIAKMHK